jgi:hypothetical protein
VRCFRIIRLDDPGVVPQPVQQLRPVGLRIDGLQFAIPDVRLGFGVVGFRIDVDAERAILAAWIAAGAPVKSLTTAPGRSKQRILLR